jgi:HlyD family secretion protein
MTARWISLIGTLILLTGCGDRPNGRLLGYVEGDYVYAAAESSGRIATLAVKRGDHVEAGAPLFTLDLTREQAALAQAEADLAQAKAKLTDLTKGNRPEEIAVIQAQLDSAKASLKLSEPRVQRRRELVKSNIVGVEQVDEAEAAILEDRNKIAEMAARLNVAKLPARDDALAAAGMAVAAQEQAVKAAQWDVDHRQILAPAAGFVEDVYYRVGEMPMQGQAVIQLLPPENLKLRLYVGEPELGGYKIGDQLRVYCDGCVPGLTAHISFISHDAEFTPPVIYSRESRAKLVYLIELKPDDPTQPWHPGQPIEADRAAVVPGAAS